MEQGVQKQKESFENYYSNEDNWNYWDDPKPLAKYLLERRIKIGIQHLQQISNSSLLDWSILIVCGGVGGEGSILANMGFTSITISDISNQALQVCNLRDKRLKTIALNAENLALASNSYDLVLVMDGIHHLPRPVLGLTEMIRVSKKAVIVIEPHTGIVANLIGREWEEQNGEINWVFRWNQSLLTQVVRSYTLQNYSYIKAIRLWNHNTVMDKIAKFFGGGKVGIIVITMCYWFLDFFLGSIGNNMIGILYRDLDN